MWKFITRGVRETLERRVNGITNVYSQSSQENNLKSEVKINVITNHKFLAPTFSAYANGAKDKKYYSKWERKRDWTEAVGWSSILAVGWVVCQSLCLHRRIIFGEKKENYQYRFSKLSGTDISLIINHILALKPVHILPIINCNGGSGRNLPVTARGSNSSSSQKLFSSITSEEGLERAKKKFSNIHSLVLGEFELLRGIEAVDEKRYEDAINHFSKGANCSSPSSIFNLGLCHELGLGTIIDYSKAAKFYADAAEKGHPDAMYNLGVFHAQGKGGLSLNIDVARSLFIRAAELGQIQAQQALDLEKRHLELEIQQNILKVFKGENTMDKNILKSIKPKLSSHLSTESANENSKKICIVENSKYYKEIEVLKNPTELFLEFLGIKQQKAIPIILNHSNY